jgi:hypothetical protein
VAFTLVTHEDAAMVATIEHALGAPLERRMLHGFDYATPRSACDTDRDCASHGSQPQRALATTGPVRSTPEPSIREAPPDVAAALPLPSTPGRRRFAPSGRRWQPAGTGPRRW